MTQSLTLRERNRLANLGNPYYDGAATSRGYELTPQRQMFLKEINRLVTAGMIEQAVALHSQATDFRVTGRDKSWAYCDHVTQGDKLRYLLGLRPARNLERQKRLVHA